MKFVVVESPYQHYTFAHPDPRYIEYAKAAMAHSLSKGEAPFLSHLLYTQVMSEYMGMDREWGITANLTVIKKADIVAFYVDYGMSPGMKSALTVVKELDIPFERRSLL